MMNLTRRQGVVTKKSADIMCNGKAKPPQSLANTCCNPAVCLETLQPSAQGIECMNQRTSWRRLLLFIAATAAVCYGIIVLYSTPVLVYLQEKFGIPQNISGSICDQCNKFSFRFLIGQENACTDKDTPYLLVLVHSHHANVDARQGIRQTWGSVKQYKGLPVKTMFTFGINDDDNLNKQLVYEQDKYHDIIQANFRDHYKTLTEKAVMSMKWATEFCPRARFVLKTDDDSFNYIQRMVRYLSEETSDPLTEPFIGGECFTVRPDRRITSKYYIPPERYPDSYYPVFCAGPAYAMSQNAVRKLLQQVNDVLYLQLEDVFITGFCRVAAGLRYTPMPGMLVGKEKIGDCDLAAWVTNTHRISPQEMRQLWDRARTLGETSGCRSRDLYIMFSLNLAFLLISATVIMTVRKLKNRTPKQGYH